jgi:hypothetical protein
MMIATQYFSYLIRIWQEEEMPNNSWLASLEDINTKQLTYFKSMEALFVFLRQVAYQEQDEVIRKNK